MLPRFRTNLQTYILESPIQQILLIKSRRRLHSVNFTHQLPDFHRNITSVVRRQRSISALNCKFIHTLQHILNFIQRSLSRLHTGNTVRCIGRCLCESSDLTAHLLRDRQSCRIICRTVDLISRRQLLRRFCLTLVCQIKHAIGIHRRDIMLYNHNLTPLSSTLFLLRIPHCLIEYISADIVGHLTGYYEINGISQRNFRKNPVFTNNIFSYPAVNPHPLLCVSWPEVSFPAAAP